MRAISTMLVVVVHDAEVRDVLTTYRVSRKVIVSVVVLVRRTFEELVVPVHGVVLVSWVLSVLPVVVVLDL